MSEDHLQWFLEAISPGPNSRGAVSLQVEDYWKAPSYQRRDPKRYTPGRARYRPKPAARVELLLECHGPWPQPRRKIWMPLHFPSAADSTWSPLVLASVSHKIPARIDGFDPWSCRLNLDASYQVNRALYSSLVCNYFFLICVLWSCVWFLMKLILGRADTLLPCHISTPTKYFVHHSGFTTWSHCVIYRRAVASTMESVDVTKNNWTRNEDSDAGISICTFSPFLISSNFSPSTSHGDVDIRKHWRLRRPSVRAMSRPRSCNLATQPETAIPRHIWDGSPDAITEELLIVFCPFGAPHSSAWCWRSPKSPTL